jgi:hypothetical protein
MSEMMCSGIKYISIPISLAETELEHIVSSSIAQLELTLSLSYAFTNQDRAFNDIIVRERPHEWQFTFADGDSGGFLKMSFPDLQPLSQADFEAKMKPVLTQFLTEYKDHLQGSVDQGQALKDMYALVHGKYQIHWKLPGPVGSPQVVVPPGINVQCVSMIVTVTVDVLMLFLGLLGLPDSVARATAKELVEEAGAEALVGLEKQIQAIASAKGIQAQAKALAAFMMSFYKITGIRQILGAIEHNMAWYEWVIMGVTITAQVTAWVATDFVAAIAEIVIEGAVVGQTVADAITCVQDCQGSVAL